MPPREEPAAAGKEEPVSKEDWYVDGDERNSDGDYDYVPDMPGDQRKLIAFHKKESERGEEAKVPVFQGSLREDNGKKKRASLSFATPPEGQWQVAAGQPLQGS